MADEETLSPSEQAYFESGGESTTPNAPEPDQQAPEGLEQPADGDLEPSGGEQLDTPKKEERVPLATLLEERKQGKEARDRLREIERQNAVLEDRWRQIQEREQKQAAPKDEDPEPDPQQDIFAHQAWLSRQYKRSQEAEQQRQTQTAEQQRQQNLTQMTRQYWEQDSSEFATQNPDFGPAAAWLAETRDKQLAAQAKLYPAFATKSGRDQQINLELDQIVQLAAQNRASPAAHVYELAKSYGYAPKPAQPAGADLAKQAENMAAAKSLSQVGGSRGEMQSGQALANMSDADFSKWLAKNGEEGFRKIAGG